jgi:formate-dependent nitrite reductase membrane component NrfD
VPVIHKPHWRWLIIWYFFLGGVSGASYAIAGVAELVSPARFGRLIRAGRFLSLACLIPCPPLLILDLGRPERFLNMLRVLKFRSPMSVGVWTLLGFSGCCGASAAFTISRSHSPVARVVGTIGLPLGMLLAGYTGVLLGATAVPLWARNVRLLGPLFLSSALGTASAALSLVPGRHVAAMHRFETLCAAIELGLAALLHWCSRGLDRPLRSGSLGRAYWLGAVAGGLVAPTLVRLAGARTGRCRWAFDVVAACLSIAGGFALKYVIAMAGHESADDPSATFEFARVES